VVSKPQSCQLKGVFYFTRQGDGGYITYRSRRKQGAENIFHSEEEVDQPEATQEGDMGDNDNEDRAMQILEGLVSGKQQLAQLLTQLVNNTQVNQNHGGNNVLGGINGHNGNQNHRGKNGAGGSNGNNGNHVEGRKNNIPTHVGTRTTMRVIPRPILPNFWGSNKQTIKGSKDRVKPLMITGRSTRLLVSVFRQPCRYRTTISSNTGIHQGISTGVRKKLISCERF
jgi:hypothetical protein